MLSKEKTINTYWLFICLMLACTVGFFVFAYVNQNVATFDWLIMQHTGDYSFADYFYHIFYGRDLTKTYNAYDVDPCFPPLTYLFYHYLYRIAPVSDMTSLKDVQTYPYYMCIFVICMSATVILFSYSVQVFNEKMLKKNSTGKNLLLTLVLLFSFPIGASAVERANPSFMVLIVLLFALAFRDSEKPVLRETALLLIAFAANIKLYPAIFGLLYLKEKRWKEAIRLLIYGIALFVIPFFFLEGLKSIKEFLVIMYLMEGRSIERMTTIRGVVTAFFMYFGGETAKWTGHMAGMIVENIYLAVTLFAFFVSKNNWKSLFLLISPMVVYVSSAYRYTAVYFAISLLMFLAEGENKEPDREDKGIMSIIYSILYVGIFAIPVWAYGFEAENVTYFFIYLMLIIVLADTFISRFKAVRAGKMA